MMIDFEMNVKKPKLIEINMLVLVVMHQLIVTVTLFFIVINQTYLFQMIVGTILMIQALEMEVRVQQKRKILLN